MIFDKENHQNGEISVEKSQDSSFRRKTVPTAAGTEIIATLICEKFQGAVWVGFGCVVLNSPTIREFNLVNPGASSVSITVDKCPSKKGFDITFGANGATSVSLDPSETVSGFVKWNPSENMSVREIAVLLMDGKHRLQLTLHGIAGMGTVSALNYLSR
jgi:hypothetical protein